MGILNNWGAGLNVYEDGQQYDFVLHPDDILKAVSASMHDGTAIGVYSPALGDSMYVTGVDNIFLDGDNTTIVLKKYDMSGHIFERNALTLNEIISVCPFTSLLKNPFLDKVEGDSDWFTIINSEENPSTIHKVITD